jgi:IS30 family transposase
LTGRQTRAQIIRKLPDGKTAPVVIALDAIERELADAFPLLFKSVTAGNGVGFSDYLGLERSCLTTGKRFALFFVHPYRSSEWGTNEHANGTIRRCFPKGTDFFLVSGRQIAKAQNWMNRSPRKIQDGPPTYPLTPF